MTRNTYYGKQVFISYSHLDKEFVERLTNDLENQGLNVWVDEKNIMVGDSISKRLEDGIYKSDFFCIVISINSAQSKWVEREYRVALNKQLSPEKKPKILPLLIDDTPPPVLLSDIKYTDFSKGYKNGFKPLLDAIKASSVNSADVTAIDNELLAILKNVDAIINKFSDSAIFCLLKESYKENILLQTEELLEKYLTKIKKNLPELEIRPSTLTILLKLRGVFKDIRAACRALSPFKRSKIVKNSIAVLNKLIKDNEENWLSPEWELIKNICHKWLAVLNKSGWVFEEDELRRPIKNPYESSSGLPVTGPTFRGREDIIKKIEGHWATDKNFSTLILYGQWRIGKTSILKNMLLRTEIDILLVYISVQKLGKVSHTGQFLLRFAEAIYSTVAKKGLPIGAPPDKSDYSDMGSGCSAFNRLLDKLAPHMTGQKRLVLAIDEFELIQEKIEDKQIHADILPYLRDIVQEYNWLGMIFAGLHVIEEMGRDYKAAFYGQAEYIRVSFLKKEDGFELIAHPAQRIALEYSPDLLEELYRLTAGQPYLIQCLCGKLVFHWNERFEQEGEKTPRTLKLDDLPHVITSDFFGSADYYFDGVWKSITENERTLMRIMAERREGTWTLDELSETAKTHSSLAKFSTLKETLELLKRHDVILEEAGNCRFAAELMRRWVAEEKHG